MASAAPQKRMVSSVFITLASPFTPTARVHSTPAAAYRRDSTRHSDTPAPDRNDISFICRDFLTIHDFKTALQKIMMLMFIISKYLDDNIVSILLYIQLYMNISVQSERCTHTYNPCQYRDSNLRPCHRSQEPSLTPPLLYAQASLEPCWACGDVIKDHVIRALERAYHPPCFVCATCRQPIGEQRFAQGEVGEVYCLRDYYRKYAPQCHVCGELIIPREDGTDSYTVECLGHSYHEDCYRCEVCSVLLSPEPNDTGCHPLDGQILCKPCHESLMQSAPR
ncbi:filamin-binding LIM protein 1 [Sinocyclocheilus grahami]|uniref:filamin-binding LIM protein 1 n=1 Tax=Sinocyclocheilus grahami TaxID=75366 RepID=UPI0007AD5F5C|nr:PREDICTED: PDZ and LIM domain protein 7-like [Sinocyclocheilus grahami]